MKIVCVVAARMVSTRLSGKSMMNILGKPMLEHEIRRIQQSKLVDEIVIATTTKKEDDVIVELGNKLGISVYRGSSEDVLDRTLKAAKAVDGNIIVQINGDCPLIDPEVCDMVIKTYLDKRPDYACNSRLKATFPTGFDTEVFSVKVLEEVDKLTNNKFDREHVTLYIYEHPEKFKLLNVTASPELNRPDLRLTVDTIEDLELVREIYKELYKKNTYFSGKDIIELFNKKPELKKINSHIKQKPARLEVMGE
jgi:spore coat polysaccharide biosynthesis protein SpsF